MLLDDEDHAFAMDLHASELYVQASELHAAHEREAALAKDLGKVKAANAELQTKLQKVTASLKSAKVTAREALIEMADQNAKLVQAFVDKKRECKQLKVSLVLWLSSTVVEQVGSPGADNVQINCLRGESQE
jgi:hypothetical protein